MGRPVLPDYIQTKKKEYSTISSSLIKNYMNTTIELFQDNFHHFFFITSRLCQDYFKTTLSLAWHHLAPAWSYFLILQMSFLFSNILRCYSCIPIFWYDFLILQVSDRLFLFSFTLLCCYDIHIFFLKIKHSDILIIKYSDILIIKYSDILVINYSDLLFLFSNILIFSSYI